VTWLDSVHDLILANDRYDRRSGGHGKARRSAATASHPALGDSILPGTLNGGPHTGDLHRADRSGYFQSVLLVVIEKEELGNGVVRKGLAYCPPSGKKDRTPAHFWHTEL
jgi:hypothetical protein